MPEPNAEILHEEEKRSLRSGTGNRAFIRFINNTDKVVEIVWICYSGSYVKYRVLKKDYFVDVNTYNTHLWVVFDYYTKDRLHIDKQFVYHPKTIRQFFKEKYPDRVIPDHYEARIRAYITAPLYSLRHMSLLAIRNLLKTPDEADTLELPKQLVDDLKKVIILRNNLMHTLNSQNVTD